MSTSHCCRLSAPPPASPSSIDRWVEVLDLTGDEKEEFICAGLTNSTGRPPPFVGKIPSLKIYSLRGCRMLDAKLWRTRCRACMWANRSRVEIQYKFEPDVRRHRDETFCYGPTTCPLHDPGEPRPVHFYKDKDSWGGPVTDSGDLDSIYMSNRAYDEIMSAMDDDLTRQMGLADAG